VIEQEPDERMAPYTAAAPFPEDGNGYSKHLELRQLRLRQRPLSATIENAEFCDVAPRIERYGRARAV
jgi:hypothetical protein